jgi:hypothetical protein
VPYDVEPDGCCEEVEQQPSCASDEDNVHPDDLFEDATDGSFAAAASPAPALPLLGQPKRARLDAPSLAGARAQNPVDLCGNAEDTPPPPPARALQAASPRVTIDVSESPPESPIRRVSRASKRPLQAIDLTENE